MARIWVLAALAAPCAWAAPSPGDAGSTIPVHVFFDAPDMSEPVMSPQGDAVAVLVRNKAGHRQLAIVDTADVHRITIAAGFDDADITQVAWADDRRLVFEIAHADESARYQKGDDWKGYGMPVLVGDPVKDAAQFASTSPLQQAARIQRPLLLAHGGIDRRVPIEHAGRLRDALEASHAPLTWLFYKDEAHGWYKPETRAAFYAAMATFLDANTGKDSGAGKP